MFYSHEVLTSRKYGVATVWLVATLGSKSTLKKVSRKAILDVDVQKACETIVTPEAPMALRLQSNLLYGVARVYSQQCGYVLHDAEAAKNSMRTIFNSMRTSELDAAESHKGRADQIILQDDPNFLPDLDLMPIDLDNLNFDIVTTEESQRSTLSPHSSQLTGVGLGSQQEIGGLIIPPSASSFIGGPVGGMGGFDVRGDSDAGTRLGPEALYEDDLGIYIEDDGNVRISDEPIRQPPGPSARGDRTDLGSVSSRVRREHEEGQGAGDLVDWPDDDDFMQLQDDDYTFGQEAEAFPPRAEEQVQQQPQITSEESAEAPIRRRAGPTRKTVPLDATMELRNSELARWNQDYVANMNDALHHKNANKAAALAKKNAEYWILGKGDEGPLSIFSGAKLLEALTGINLITGKKRAREEAGDTAVDRRVRPRSDEPSFDEVARRFEDDGFMPMMGDDTVEQGREAPTPLDDRHHSSIMPWMQSAGSGRATGHFSGAGMPTSASLGGGAGAQLGRRGSRLTSASPLMGRGPVDDNVDDFQLPGSQADIAMTGVDELELFGPAAQVDTQTVAQSQWQRAELDGESGNFLEFVQAGIQELDLVRDQAGQRGEEVAITEGSINFNALLSPESHSCVVAAQALLHVLALGTKNLLDVQQEEAFGGITMRVVSAQ